MKRLFAAGLRRNVLVFNNIMGRYVVSHCRQNTYFIFGVCIGLCLSLISKPITPEKCIFTDDDSSNLLVHDLPSLVNSKPVDEYEPKINLAGKPQKPQKTPQTLIRPRYYSTELGIREKLFVGVLTSQSSITSQGVAFNKTIAHLIDKIMYFIDAPGPHKLNISMPGVVGFTDTRQILKPFHMLKYIADNYLDEFDFFYLVRDTTYVKARKLYELVQSVSVSENVHVGSDKKDSHTSFCSLDAGILLSNSVMQKILASLDWCVKNAFSESDSDNVGRCILHATDIKCEDSVQGIKFPSFRLPDNFNVDDNLETLLQDENFKSALSLYPVLKSTEVYKLHAYFCKVALNESRTQILKLRHSIARVSTIAPHNETSWPIGNHRGNVPRNRFDVLRWDHFTQAHSYLDTEFSNIKSLKGANLLEIQYIINASIMRLSSDYNGNLEYRGLVNGFRRFDPSRGIDYRLNLAFQEKSSGQDVLKWVEVCKPLGKVEVIPMPYVTENSRINMILPITVSRINEAKQFIQRYQTVAMEKHDKTFLMLVLLYNVNIPGKGTREDAFYEIKSLALSLSEKYKRDGSKIAWVSVKLPQSMGPSDKPLLDIGVIDLTVKRFNPDSLILIVEPNMELRQDYLNRVRMNTILGWQVFSPIPFSEFNPYIVSNSPPPKDLDINKTYGHFNPRSTTHISFYASDYLNTRKIVQEYVPIVKSDRDLGTLSQVKNKQGANQWLDTIYAMFVNTKILHTFRAVEPGLRLRYVEQECATTQSTSYYEQCIANRNLNLGTRSHLAKIILDYKTQHKLM